MLGKVYIYWRELLLNVSAKEIRHMPMRYQLLPWLTMQPVTAMKHFNVRVN
jgi:hypothetical protein